ILLAELAQVLRIASLSCAASGCRCTALAAPAGVRTRTRSARIAGAAAAVPAALVVAIGSRDNVAVLLCVLGDALVIDDLLRIAAQTVQENDQGRGFP